ncbi:MAG: hypothetical protein M3Z04_22825 [Chloroflexota bacterium]|nr:hypothetical protein [Chloroflexota bacterium]
MQTIQAIATVTDDGELTLQVPEGIAPGRHQVVLVIDEKPIQAQQRTLGEFPVLDFGPWPENFSLRREDLYDDDGR